MNAQIRPTTVSSRGSSRPRLYQNIHFPTKSRLLFFLISAYCTRYNLNDDLLKETVQNFEKDDKSNGVGENLYEKDYYKLYDANAFVTTIGTDKVSRESCRSCFKQLIFFSNFDNTWPLGYHAVYLSGRARTVTTMKYHLGDNGS